MSIPVARLNHAVLFVRDAERAAEFYTRIFGFEVVGREMGGQAIFLRSPLEGNHHDLGLFSVGPQAPNAPRGSVGLYHLAWEVPTIEDLAAARATCRRGGRARRGERPRRLEVALRRATRTATSSRSCGASRARRGARTSTAGRIRPLDLEREVARFGGDRAPAPG